MTSPTSPNIAYVWMVFPRTPELSDYERYREVRKNALAHYCYACKDAFPKHNIIVGIACDAINHEGASEELIYVHTDEWSEAEYAEAKRIRKELGLLKNIIPSYLTYERSGNRNEVRPVRKNAARAKQKDKKKSKKRNRVK